MADGNDIDAFAKLIAQSTASESAPIIEERYKKLHDPTFMKDAYTASEGQSVSTKSDVWTLSDDQEYQQLLTQYSKKRVEFEQIITDQVHRMSGKGGYYNQFQNTLSRIDKFGQRIMSSTAELNGLTFITRPKLNLSTAVLKQDPQLIVMNTTNPNSIAFYIRMLLDTKLSKSDVFAQYVQQSALFDGRNPWLVPLMNNLTDISGFPDPTLDVFTSEGGFFNEDISFAAGSDRCRRTFELQLTFNDVQYGVLMAMLQFWYEWIGLLNQGITTPYMEDMEQRRIPYTVSIYRFMFDPSRRYITRYCKCTGCFPRAVPVGGVFNVSQGEVFNSSAAKFTVPFTCNVFESNKATIIQDFNMLAERYCPQITKDSYKTAMLEAESNFIGLPYIIPTTHGPQMLWRFDPTKDNPNYANEALDDILNNLTIQSEKLQQIEMYYQEQELNKLNNPTFASLSGTGSVYSTSGGFNTIS